MEEYKNEKDLREEIVSEMDSVPVEETVETVVEEDQVEETLTEETTPEEVSAEEVPVEETPAEEQPARENIADKVASKPRTVLVVGVRFRTAGKSYYYTFGDLKVTTGMHVVAPTARGLEYGTIVTIPMEIERRKIKSQIRELARIATPEDDAAHIETHRMEREAYRTCYKKIRERNLDMKLIDAEYTFDHSKILFYFTADGRIDFRDLVKDLAGIFKTRIELRQIGVRDETRILGGYGSCGRPLCCHSYLNDFVPVSIKMAKEQNLSLNPTKISGICGRLMCCLKNEADTYAELNKNLPRQGDEVEGPDGLQGEVIGVNVLRQKVRIIVEVDDDKEVHEYNADEITMIRRRKRGEAKSRSKRIEAGQERAEDLRKTSRKPRPAQEGGEQTERAERSDRNDRNASAGSSERRPERRENNHRRQDGHGGPGRDREQNQNREQNQSQNREQNGERGERSERSGNRRRRRGRGHGGQHGNNQGGGSQNGSAPTGGEN